MKARVKVLFKIIGILVVLLIAAGLIAPTLTADQYGRRLQASLERALGRRVEISNVRFNVFKGPGFSVGNVTIYEDPSIGIEPVVYIQEPDGALEVVPSIWSLLGGRFDIASIRLEGASITLTKSGPASEWGRWNFSSIVNPSLIRTAPAIKVRDSRIHFKFGDTKSVFYLTQTDLDVSPTRSGDWKVDISARPARTDRSAQGLGSFRLKGRWYADPGRGDLDLQIERAALGELTALMSGQDAGVHGTLTSRLHLAGPLNNIGITGRLDVVDVHRWDLMPGNGQGWPLEIRGRLDLIKQQVELHSSTSGNGPLPLAVHFRATDYLSQPHWAVGLNWNRFPVAPILELARHMGAQFPPKLQLTGTMDGAIGFTGETGAQGALAFHDTAVAIPDSPPLRFDQAHIILEDGRARLSPTIVRGGENDQARIDGEYVFAPQTFDLSISADAMKVQSLRAQAALAAVPCLEQVTGGQWSGDLHYHREPEAAAWNGRLVLTDAEMAIPGLADPLQLTSANAQIDGARVVLDRIDAHVGNLAFTGDYRYEPGASRPHRMRLRAAAWDAADIEAELLPTLRRNTNLIARTLGRPMLTDWLRERNLDGTVQIADLAIGGEHLENFRARVLWDVARVQLDSIQATLDRATLSGKLDVNLRGSRPNYKLTSRIKGMAWQGGKVDAETTMETFGTGAQLLMNATAAGTFTGSAVEFGTLPPLRGISGTYSFSWWQAGPRLQLTGLTLRTDEETFTGSGATRDDGRLMIQLTNGAREMRMSGTLAKLKVE